MVLNIFITIFAIGVVIMLVGMVLNNNKIIGVGCLIFSIALPAIILSKVTFDYSYIMYVGSTVMSLLVLMLIYCSVQLIRT